MTSVPVRVFCVVPGGAGESCSSFTSLQLAVLPKTLNSCRTGLRIRLISAKTCTGATRNPSFLSHLIPPMMDHLKVIVSYIVYKVSIQSGVHPVRFAAFMPSFPSSPEIPLLKRPYALFLLSNCKRPALSGLTMSQSGGVFSPFSSLFQAFSPRFVLLQFP